MADQPNQAQQEAQRRADEQRRAQQQPPPGAAVQPQRPPGGYPSEQGQRGADAGRQAAQQRFEEEKRMVGERPQQTGNEGSQPTPTQQENDEIRAGLRHIDDKEDDRSGPDIRYELRRVEADQTKGKYETR